jgi:hypothetical protein
MENTTPDPLVIHASAAPAHLPAPFDPSRRVTFLLLVTLTFPSDAGDSPHPVNLSSCPKMARNPSIEREESFLRILVGRVRIGATTPSHSQYSSGTQERGEAP